MAGWCQCVNRSFSLGMATGLQRQEILLISEFEQPTSMESFAYIYMDLRNVSCLIATSGNLWKRDASRQKPEPLDNDCFPVSVRTKPVYSIDQFGNSYSNPYKLYISEWSSMTMVWREGNSILLHSNTIHNGLYLYIISDYPDKARHTWDTPCILRFNYHCVYKDIQINILFNYRLRIDGHFVTALWGVESESVSCASYYFIITNLFMLFLHTNTEITIMLQSNFEPEFPELVSQNLSWYCWLTRLGNSKKHVYSVLVDTL